MYIWTYFHAVVGFQDLKALWKAYEKRNQFAQFFQRHFEPIFAEATVKGMHAHFQFVLNTHLGL